MPEHKIRLRGGWLQIHPDRNTFGSWLTFPLAQFPNSPDDLRFARSFQRPPLDPERETLWLDLQSVPGLISIALNGRGLVREANPGHVESLPLGIDLPSRNQLILQVNPSIRPEQPWGVIALVIRGKQPFPQSD